MSKKKAELAADSHAYHRLISSARQCLAVGLYKSLVLASVEALLYVDGMMEYGRRFENAEFRSVEAIDNILRFAPLLFDQASLRALGDALKSQKRIERNATEDLAGRLAEASRELWQNYALWVHVEAAGEVRQDELRTELSGDQDYWRWVCEAWDKMGLVVRSPSRSSYIVSLKTRSGEVVRAKCSFCGRAQEAPKAMFFEVLRCPECSVTSAFVILAVI